MTDAKTQQMACTNPVCRAPFHNPRVGSQKCWKRIHKRTADGSFKCSGLEGEPPTHYYVDCTSDMDLNKIHIDTTNMESMQSSESFLGVGRDGFVRKFTYTNHDGTTSTFALKAFNKITGAVSTEDKKRQDKINKANMENAQKEYTFLRMIRHKFINKYIGQCTEHIGDGVPCLLSPLHEGGTLRALHESLRNDEVGMQTRDLGQIVRNLCEAGEFLHEKGTSHYDLRSANIMFSLPFKFYLGFEGKVRERFINSIKIIDFSNSFHYKNPDGSLKQDHAKYNQLSCAGGESYSLHETSEIAFLGKILGDFFFKKNFERGRADYQITDTVKFKFIYVERVCNDLRRNSRWAHLD